MPTLKQNLIAEALGSFFLIVAAIGSCILARDVLHADLALTVLINAISVALVLFALIETFGAVSGSHFNPAVTIALFATKQVSKKKAAAYMAAQFAGGFLGLVVTQLMFYDTNHTVLVISDNVKSAPLLLSEFIGTFLLIGVIIGCVRGGSKHTGLSVAAVVGGMLIATSSTMFANPMVTFCRIFTYAICGLAPVSAILFIIAEVAGALAAVYVFSILYPTKLKDKCDPYDCKSDRPIRIDGLGP